MAEMLCGRADARPCPAGLSSVIQMTEPVHAATILSVMSRRAAKVLLWLFVINLGIAFGAGLYESRIVVPRWLTPAPEDGFLWNAEAVRQDNTGLRFWVYVTTIPLTVITLANLLGAWRARGSASGWWAVGRPDRAVRAAVHLPLLHPDHDRAHGGRHDARGGGRAHGAAVGEPEPRPPIVLLVAMVAALKAFARIYRSNRSLA